MSASSSTSVSSTGTSYLVVVPIPYSPSLENRVSGIVQHCLLLTLGSSGEWDFTVVLGINAKAEDFTRIQKSVATLSATIMDKYFHTPIYIESILFPWDSTKVGSVNYAQIRNLAWYSPQVKMLARTLIRNAKAQSKRVRMIALDPDTRINAKWLHLSEGTKSLITAGYYNYSCSNPPPFIDSVTHKIHWNNVVAQVGSALDLLGKQYIGSMTFLGYLSSTDALQQLGYDEKDKEKLDLFLNKHLKSFAGTVQANYLLLGDLRYNWLRPLHDVYKELDELLTDLRWPLTAADSVYFRKTLPPLLAKLVQLEAKYRRDLDVLRPAIKGKQILYPNEALLAFSLYERGVNNTPLLLEDCGDARNRIWGISGAGEGQAALCSLQGKTDGQLIDYVKAPPYESEIPDRCYKIHNEDLSVLPKTVTALRNHYYPRVGFPQAMIEKLSSIAFEKSQSCLQKHFLTQRKKLIQEIVPMAQRRHLEVQLEEVISWVYRSSMERAAESFQAELFMQLHCSSALEGIPLNVRDRAKREKLELMKTLLVHNENLRLISEYEGSAPDSLQ